MLYNSSVLRPNPIVSGYQVQLFIQGTGTSDFQSGSGRFIINSPKFSITGMEFEGRNTLQEPTGEGRTLIEDYQNLNRACNLKCFFSGDFNGITGLGTRNIKFLSIFTGNNVQLSPDLIGNTNLIARQPASINEGMKSFIIPLGEDDINFRVEENISYKVVPQDYVNFGETTTGVSGIMFEGLDDFPNIETEEVFISRQTINDLRFAQAKQPVGIYNPCTIHVDGGIVKDFSADFRSYTTGLIIISGNGVDLETDLEEESEVSVVKNSVRFLDIDKAQFSITPLFDRDGGRTSFFISE